MSEADDAMAGPEEAPMSEKMIQQIAQNVADGTRRCLTCGKVFPNDDCWVCRKMRDRK